MSDPDAPGRPASTDPDRPDSGRVLTGVRWVASAQFLSQGVKLSVSIALARLLAPEDFGLVAMAAVFTALGTLISTLGVGPIIVQRQTLGDGLLRSLASLGLAMGFGLWGAIALASGAIALFFDEPRVGHVVAWLAATFAASSLGMVPEGLLQREMRFPRLVAIDMAALAVISVGAVSMAALGYGVWALVIPNVSSTFLRSLLLLLSSPRPVRLGFDWAETRGVLGFGGSVLGFNAMQYLLRNVDRLIIGRALGPTELGLYHYAYQLYNYPLEAITLVMIRVMFPTFSRLQNSLDELGRTFLRVNGAIALVTFPMMAGLAVVAGPFVRVVLGEKWSDVIPLVYILAPLGALQSITATPGQIFLATGNAALRLWWSMIYTTAIVCAFFAGIPWGILGVASAYAIAMVPIAAVAFWLALRLVHLPLVALWHELWRTTASVLVMAGAVLALETWLAARGVDDLASLVAGVAIGVCVYLAALWVLRPQAIEDVLLLLPLDLRLGR